MQSKSVKLGLALLLGMMGGVATAETSSVHLYNWYDFIEPETPKAFEKESGVSMVLDTFDSIDVMQSKLMVGHTGYDVVVVSGDALPNLIKAGVLAELDRSQLPNWNHLDPEILAKVHSNDPDNRYAAPYMWGTTGIGYDVDKVTQVLGADAPVNSWDLIFKEENIARLGQCGVAMLDSPSEIIPIALHYLGLPPNSKDPADYRKAEELLMKIRPHVRYFDSSKFITDLANGNICAVVGWAGGVYDAQVNSERANNGRHIAYQIPREGAPVWVESFVLLKDAPHPKAAMDFIDYMLRPEVVARSSNYLGYPNANKDATAHVEEKLRSNPGAYPSKETMATLFPLEPLPLKLERVRTRVWSKVRSGT
ncbi:polyamine ABC transporter substrate-binding protein [Pseudomonas sp. BN411]|nr:polyamine ABC transporter substrate-binding protein [Pseudomonas sp. BN411]